MTTIHDYATPAGRTAWESGIDGIFLRVPFSVYLKDPRLSGSTIFKAVDGCMAEMKDAIDNGSDFESEAVDQGEAFHTALLEPDRFRVEYALAPYSDKKDPDTGERGSVGWGTETWRSAAKLGKIYRKQWHIPEMVAAVRRDVHTAPAFARPGMIEVSIRWTDAETGVKLRGRLDWLSLEAGIIADLKKAREVKPRLFSQQAFNLGYPVKMALYHDGLSTLTGGRDFDVHLMAVQDSSPFLVTDMHLPCRGDNDFEDTGVSAWLWGGRVYYRHALRRYLKAVQTGEWSAYPVSYLNVPQWWIERAAEIAQRGQE